MTDNEIIKGLECCVGADTYCGDCPYNGTDCKWERDVLDLINRQKAEVDGLKERDETAEKIIREQGGTILSLQDEVSRLNDMLEHRLDESNNKTIEIVKLHHEIQCAKAEAIKEFAERLDNASYITEYIPSSTGDTIKIRHITMNQVRSIMKEMVGDNNG